MMLRNNATRIQKCGNKDQLPGRSSKRSQDDCFSTPSTKGLNYITKKGTAGIL